MSDVLTPEYYIKRDVIKTLIEDGTLPHDMKFDTVEEFNNTWEYLTDKDLHHDYLSELRTSGTLTNIPREYSRHYESESVALKFDDVWIGWTYWFGGGKHGNPEGIDWISNAYFLTVVKEEEVIVLKRTFAKI